METVDIRWCSTPYTQAGTATTANSRRTISVPRARPFWEQHFFIPYSWRQNSAQPLEIKTVQCSFETFTSSSQTFEYSDTRVVIRMEVWSRVSHWCLLLNLVPFSHSVTEHCTLPVLHITNSKMCYFLLLWQKLSLLSCFQAVKKKCLQMVKFTYSCSAQ